VTEQEWLEGADPLAMLELLRDGASERKLRLFAVACCRNVWTLMPSATCRRAVEVAERYAEGLADRKELRAAWRPAWRTFDRWENRIYTANTFGDPMRNASRNMTAHDAAEAALLTAESAAEHFQPPYIARAAANAHACHVHYDPDLYNAPNNHAVRSGRRRFDPEHPHVRARREQEVAQCGFLREIFGNPFRAVAVDRAWLAWNDGTVAKMAQTIYDEQRHEDLPILADALEDAGCGNGEMLTHCRAGGEHLRGCWVMDLLLGNG
jgi:hypothetical protein